MLRGLVATLGLLIASCGTAPLTEILIVVESDLSLPTELDGVRVQVDGLGSSRVSTGPLRSAADLPATVALVQRGGALGPLEIATTGQLHGAPVIERRANVDFVPGQVRVLRLRLDRACLGIACPGETCANGACRSERIDPAELEPYREDLASDAGTPPPVDGATPTCPIDAVCGHGPEHLPGDRISLGPCRTIAEPFQVVIHLPSGLLSDTPQMRLIDPGAYDVTLSVPSIDGCIAHSSFEVVGFEPMPDTNRPAIGAIRAMDARIDAAFVAARTGAFAITSTGWADLSTIATGALPATNLAAVQVWNGDVFFGAMTSETAIGRAIVAADLASVELETGPLLPTGRRPVHAIALPLGGTSNGDRGPMVLATTDGVVAYDAIDAAPRPLDPAFNATAGLALGRTEPAARGAVWAISPAMIAHLALGSGARWMGGASQPLGMNGAMGIAIDDREPTAPRLWLCTMNGGVFVYDLAGDWSTRVDLGAPIAMQAARCGGLDLDEDGAAWAADATGLLRVDSDLASGVQLDAAQGLPAPVIAVAVAWDEAARAVWAMGPDGQVLVARARRD